MPALRFVTARDLFDAFPIALDELNEEPVDEPSLDYMQALAARGAVDKAIGFCAFLLPRREAVWWGIDCIKTLIANPTDDEVVGVQVAEDWVREPEEEQRLAALRFGQDASRRLAPTWLALAAGWAGPTMPLPTGETMPIEAHQTARAVRAAVLIAATSIQLATRSEMLRKCLDRGMKLAAGDSRPE